MIQKHQQTVLSVTILAILLWNTNCVIDKYTLQNLSTLSGPADDTLKLNEIRNPEIPPEGIRSEFDLDVPPRPVSIPDPEYPEKLRYKRVEGSVKLLFIIDSTGTVTDPQILYATDSLFAESVLKSIPSWKVAPGEIEGNPVSCYKKHTFDFILGSR